MLCVTEHREQLITIPQSSVCWKVLDNISTKTSQHILFFLLWFENEKNNCRSFVVYLIVTVLLSLKLSYEPYWFEETFLSD